MNMFDQIAEAQTALENGIVELERDYGYPYDTEMHNEQVNRALTNLRTARRVLREVMND